MNQSQFGYCLESQEGSVKSSELGEESVVESDEQKIPKMKKPSIFQRVSNMFKKKPAPPQNPQDVKP